MDRRSYLEALTGASVIAVLGGCVSRDDTPSDDTGSEDGDESNGDERESADEAYRTYEVDGKAVPLAPVEETYEWYQDGALFLDATNEQQHQQARIEGSKLSPPNAPDYSHPTDDVDTDVRIVTYCVCPHQLAGARAAELMEEGFEDVFAIDEGLQGWQDAGYPMSSGSSSIDPSSYTIFGRTDPSVADEAVWLVEPETAQQYVTHVEIDGTFELEFDFYAVDDDTVVSLVLPSIEIERTLGELSERELAF